MYTYTNIVFIRIIEFSKNPRKALRMNKGYRPRKFVSILLIAVLLSAAVSVLPQAVSQQSSTTVSMSGIIGPVTTRPLHTEGRYIKDDLGNIVLLRGVDRGGFNNDPQGRWEAQGEMYQGGLHNFRPSAVSYQMSVMKNTWGISANRWTMPIEWWLSNTTGFRAYLRQAIMIAQDYGIYIILVPYSVAAGTAADPMPFPPYTTRTNIIPNEDAFVSFWLSVATEVGSLPNVIFDIYNEPNSGNQPSDQARLDWQRVWQKCVNAIRSVSNALILIQWGYGCGPNGNMNWVNDYPIAGTNLVISTHLYSTSLGYAYPPDSSYQYLNSTFQANGIRGVALSRPLLIGEIGAISSEAVFMQNALQVFNDYQLGYLAWMWAPGPDGNPVYYGLLQNTGYVPPPNAIGQILIDAIATG